MSVLTHSKPTEVVPFSRLYVCINSLCTECAAVSCSECVFCPSELLLGAQEDCALTVEESSNYPHCNGKIAVSGSSCLHTHPFNGPSSGTTQVSRYQKRKTNLDFTVSGSGISWATCKSAPRSRQITTPAPHHSVFYRPGALPAAQPTASKH